MNANIIELLIDFGKRRHLMGNDRDDAMLKIIDDHIIRTKGEIPKIDPRGDVNHLIMNCAAELVMDMRVGDLALLGNPRINGPKSAVGFALTHYKAAIKKTQDIRKMLEEPELNRNIIMHVHELMKFCQKHHVFGFATLFEMVPITMGFCSIEELPSEVPPTIMPAPTIDHDPTHECGIMIDVIETGYLAPMYRYLDRVILKMKAMETKNNQKEDK